MTDREKVIKAIELEIKHENTWECRKECPYYGKTDCNCFTQVLVDALELLKGHIMTPEEVEAVGQGDWVWIEIRHTGALYPAIRWDNDFIGGNDDYVMLCEVTECDDYLRDYRFWSAQPTEEQMREEQWHAR